MSFFIPTAAAGNSLSLATFGRSGEIMGFFYPRIDFAQNIREGMPAVRLLDRHDGDQFLWSFAECWRVSQSFGPASNVLVTRLDHVDLDLHIELSDVLPPGEHALMRRVTINKGPDVGRVQFLHYFHMAVGDSDERNGVQVYRDQNAVVQEFRGIALAVSANQRFVAYCSTWEPGVESPTKYAMQMGERGWSNQSIGRVDFAVEFDPVEDGRWKGMLVLAGGTSIHQAMDYAVELSGRQFNDVVSQANDRALSALTEAGSCPVPELSDAFGRAVISLYDLFDENEGTFIAAPEFDPGYRLSGGYGYCWPRDAVICALVCQQLGRPRMGWRFFEWSARAQLPDGHWFQRYWGDGSPAPSWCVLNSRIQLDQTCAMVHAAGQFARRLGADRQAFVEFYRPVVERATEAVLRHIGENYLHKPASDLWENAVGSFAYTQAGAIAALKEAEEVFGLDGERVGEKVRKAMREQLIKIFWQPEHQRWLRRITEDGHPDGTLDSSVMGLIDPWEVLDLLDVEDRRLATLTLEGISQDLRSEVKGGGAILRFQNEAYMGGGPGCVNTLWLGLCWLRLAVTASEAKERERCKERAMSELRIALANASPTGQLPELIPKIMFDYWAAPHGWACSLLIEAVLALRLLHKEGEGPFEVGRAQVRRQAPASKG